MNIKIIIISANEPRHKYLRRKIGLIKGAKVRLCLAEKNSSRAYYKVLKSKVRNVSEKKHFMDRKKNELKYFGKFLRQSDEIKNLKLIDKGEANFNQRIIQQVNYIKPDVIISFGCSIIKGPILRKFKNKFINIHLGLTPYYKGSATNFWPLVNNEPQFLGVSFLKIDEGVDTGPIIHQIRADLDRKDSVHDIGNKLIIKMANSLEKLILNHKKITWKNQKKIKKIRIYKNKDYNLLALRKLKSNLKKGLILKYLKRKSQIDKKYPLIEFKA